MSPALRLLLCALCALSLGCDDTSGAANGANTDSQAADPDTQAPDPDTQAPDPDTQTSAADSQGADPDADADDADDADDAEDTAEVSDPLPPLPTLRACFGGAFSPSYTGDWEHDFTSPIVASGQAGHSVEDVLLTWGASAAQVEGKFAYGAISKDLEDEPVRAWIDGCGGWLDLGTAHTDSDGRVRFSVPAEVLAEPGRYEVRMVVQGDGSQAAGDLLVTPAGTAFVVFDIDGTLTTSDSELVQEFFLDLFGGQHVPTPYAGARDVVQAYADAGYEVLYMTGRPYWLSGITRAWLAAQGMPRGNLRLTRSNTESLPTEGGVGAYKRDYLRQVMSAHTVARAYGNATTDIFAYTQAPLPLSEVFIIGDYAGEGGTQAVSDYPTHLGAVRILRAAQPFVR